MILPICASVFKLLFSEGSVTLHLKCRYKTESAVTLHFAAQINITVLVCEKLYENVFYSQGWQLKIVLEK